MPTVGGKVTFRSGTYDEFLNLESSQINNNAMYFCTDTQQIFIGSVEYTRRIQSGKGAPSQTSSSLSQGALYYDSKNKTLYSYIDSAWINISNYIDSADIQSVFEQSVSELDARLDNIIAHNNDSEGNSELIDIRTGTDGTVYNSAGAAVRGQVEKINDKLSDIDGAMQYDTESECDSIKNGYYIAGQYTENNGYKSKVYDVTTLRGQKILVSTYVYNQWTPVVSFYLTDRTLITDVTVSPSGYYSNYEVSVPDNASWATVTCKIGTYDGVQYDSTYIHLKYKNYIDVNDLKSDVETNTDNVSDIQDTIDSFEGALEKIDESLSAYMDSERYTVRNGYYIAGQYTEDNGYKSKLYEIDNLQGQKILVSTYVYTQYTPIISFYTSNMTLLQDVLVSPTGYYTDYEVAVPNNAIKATITCKIGTYDNVQYNSTYIHLKYKTYVSVSNVAEDVDALKDEVEVLQEEYEAYEAPRFLNHWYGKKVVWLGTSVSFGSNAAKSYAKEAADALGFELVNASVPGQAIHTTANGGIVGNGSTCLSIEEYQDLGVAIADSPVAYTPGGNYNNYYRTYEHIFSQENADADLWVFDVFPNNTDFSTTDWSAFDRGQWKYSDNSAFSDHRNSFYGALLFLLDKLYKLNPEARVVFVIGSAFKISDAITATETLRSTALHYQTIDLWGRINSNVKTNTYLYSLGGTDMHPSAKAHELMGRMLIGEFLSLA